MGTAASRFTLALIGRSRGQGWRLKAYFALLVALFVAAAAVATAYVFVQTDRDARSKAEADASFAAKTGAKQLGDAVGVLRATVDQLAATPRIEQVISQPAACSLSFSGPGGLESGHIDILRPDGSVACSSRARSGGAPLAGYVGEEWVSRARTGKVFVAPIVDAPTGVHAALSAAPIKGHGIVAGFLALEPAGPGLAALYGGGRPVEFLVTSRDGRDVIARSINPGRWVGETLQGTGFAPGATNVERRDLDGTERLYRDASVPGVGWRFHAGEDKATALAAGNRLQNRQLIIIMVGLALVLLAALFVYRRVALPVTRLGTAVRSTSAHATPAPVAASGPAEVTALADDINGLISSVNRELAERRRAEQAAHDSERNYRLLFENSPLPMWIYDAETLAILEVNDAAVAQYGYSRNEFLGLTMDEIGTESAEPSELAGQARTRHRRKDGTEIDVNATTHTVIFGDRSARVVLAEDVGERERLESQLRQAQRMEAVGRLAGGVAHDFNNLLTVVIGYTDLALAQMPPDELRRGEVDEIKKAGERAVALTRQLLAFSRGQVLEPVVFDLNGTVEGIEQMLKRLVRADISLETDLRPDAGRVLADRGQIEQVIVNLVVNAIDAMPEGGRVSIATRAADLGDEYFRLHPAAQAVPGPYAVLEVTDTGIGMDEETMAHIFEPFFTTKGEEKGTGLGLATVYGIISQSGGFVWVYSEPGQGTSFKVYLPAVAAAASEPARRRATPQLPSERAVPGGTVLLVEDDPTVRMFVRRILESQRFEILEASAGDEALELSERAGRDSIDVLLTDSVIPGLGGIELAERVRARHPTLSTLLMSGYTELFATGGLELPPGTKFIAKPFGPADLSSKLDELLAERLSA